MIKKLKNILNAKENLRGKTLNIVLFVVIYYNLISLKEL